MNVCFVNAFTTELNKGNQAAVVLVDKYPSPEKMLILAKEFGFSETAFIQRISVDNFNIRWLTPQTEVNLCGHATLASAKVIFEEIVRDLKRIVFHSKSGELIVTKDADYLILDFPIDVPSPIKPDNSILKALSKYNASEVLFAPKTKNLIFVYQKEEIVRNLAPDFEILAELKSEYIFGIITTSSAKGQYDYICRYFAPWEGINEDPVTGSAQVSLAPYWTEKLNKEVLNGYQASERSGEFSVKVVNDRVLISGNAVLYLSGKLLRGL